MKAEGDKHLFRLPCDGEAVELCRLGMTPAKIERTLQGGAGLDYLAKKWQMTASKAAGLAVHYGIWKPAEANAKLRRIYS